MTTKKSIPKKLVTKKPPKKESKADKVFSSIFMDEKKQSEEIAKSTTPSKKTSSSLFDEIYSESLSNRKEIRKGLLEATLNESNSDWVFSAKSNNIHNEVKLLSNDIKAIYKIKNHEIIEIKFDNSVVLIESFKKILGTSFIGYNEITKEVVFFNPETDTYSNIGDGDLLIISMNELKSGLSFFINEVEIDLTTTIGS